MAAQRVDLYQPIINSRIGPPPLALRIGVTRDVNQVVGGVPTGVTQIETYVLLSALPSEMQERVKLAMQLLLAGGWTMLNFNVEVTPEGTMILDNDRTRISILSDGTLMVSSRDPVMLTGDCLVKLDNPSVDKPALGMIQALLMKSFDRKRAK